MQVPVGLFLTERFYLKLILHVNMRPQTRKGEVSLGLVRILVVSDGLDCLLHSILTVWAAGSISRKAHWEGF